MANTEMEVIVTTLRCTIREWYAGLAMQAMVSAWARGGWNHADVANEACRQADALIAELAKEEKL